MQQRVPLFSGWVVRRVTVDGIAATTTTTLVHRRSFFWNLIAFHKFARQSRSHSSGNRSGGGNTWMHRSSADLHRLVLADARTCMPWQSSNRWMNVGLLYVDSVGFSTVAATLAGLINFRHLMRAPSRPLLFITFLRSRLPVGPAPRPTS